MLGCVAGGLAGKPGQAGPKRVAKPWGNLGESNEKPLAVKPLVDTASLLVLARLSREPTNKSRQLRRLFRVYSNSSNLYMWAKAKSDMNGVQGRRENKTA